MDAKPNSNSPSSVPAEATAPPFNLQTVLVALRCWWKAAVPAAVVLSAIAGTVVYFITPPTYTASAWLIIKANQENLLREQGQNDSVRFIANQTELIKSPPIVDPVASKPAVAATPEIAREPDLSQAIIRKVKIRSLSRSDFFVIEFSSTVPKQAALVANELAKSYFAHQQRDATFRTSALIRLLEDQLTTQQAKVEDLRKRWRDLAMTTSGIDPFAVKPTENNLQLHNPNAELQSQLLKIQMEQLTLEVQIKYLESELAIGTTAEPTPWELEQMVQKHPDVERQLMEVAMHERKLSEYRERVANPDKNTALMQIEKDISKAQERLAKVQEQQRPKLKEELAKILANKLDSDLARRRQELSANKLMQTVIQERLTTQITSQKEFREKSFDEEMLRTEYESSYKLYEAIKAKIDMMRLEQRAPDRVEMFKEASIPVRPDVALPFKKMGMAAIAAFLLPFGLAVGVELLFRRVTTRDQLEHGGKITVVGEVTSLPRKLKRNSNQKNGRHWELQLFEESIDGLRTYLSLVNSLHDMKVLAVASAISREGKTSLAAQLAISMATSTGEPTLLVDGDLRSPDIHRIFGIDRGPGVVEILDASVSVEDAINDSFSDQLHLLPAGECEISPHRIVGNGKFAAMILKLREKYRHIIIDTPPVLAASEALVMARAADATILCVRRDFSRVGQVQDAYARLQGAGVNTAGAVLNGVPSRQYAYRYGSYYFDQAAVGADVVDQRVLKS